MKPNPWIFPALAVLITGAWIGSQKRSAATLEREITVITERIRKAGAIGDDDLKGREDKANQSKDKDGKIDWKDLAGKIGHANHDSMPDMRTLMRIQRLLMDATVEDLCAQLDEIAALDIDEKSRKQLQSMITGVLVEKDPKLAVERFASALEDEDSGMNWQIGAALGKWAGKDPLGAATWLDNQIASGNLDSKSLDGKNDRRLRFEGGVVNALLDTNPSAAASRLSSLPEEQREQVLRDGFSFQLRETNEAAYAKVVRDSLPADKVAGILASRATNFAMSNKLERVDGFITNVKANAAEKEVIVGEVMKVKMREVVQSDINVEEFEKARAWGAARSPGVVEKTTGEALADTLYRGMDFSKTSELVLKYNETSSNDEVLASFLKSDELRQSDAKAAKALIEKIKDPALREEILKLPQYNR